MLLENFWLKVIALLIGFLLWFHVATEKIYKHEIQLPVTEIVLGDSLTLVDNPPDSLVVLVSASGKQLLRSKWRQRGIRINATQFRAGRHVINFTTENVSLVGAPTDIQLEEVVSPTSMSFLIDHITEKQVDVIVDLVTERDEGFAVSRVSNPVPPKVTVIGARSLLHRLKSVSTVHKELTRLRNSLTITLPLLPPKGYNISMIPDSVTVQIEVVPVKTRIFKDIPIVIFNAPQDKEIQVEPPSLDIELTGPPEDVDLLNRNALVASVNYNNVKVSGYAPVKIDCPSSFSVKRTSVDSVRVVMR